MGDESDALTAWQKTIDGMYRNDWGMMEESDHVIPMQADNSKVVPMTIEPPFSKRVSVSEKDPTWLKNPYRPTWEDEVDASDDESIMTQLAAAEERERELLKVIDGLMHTISAIDSQSDVSESVAYAYRYEYNEYSDAVFKFIAGRAQEEEVARVKERERQERLRREARAKLTREEREALGLE